MSPLESPTNSSRLPDWFAVFDYGHASCSRSLRAGKSRLIFDTDRSLGSFSISPRPTSLLHANAVLNEKRRMRRRQPLDTVVNPSE